MGRRRQPPTATIGVVRINKKLADKVLLLLEDPLKPGTTQYGAMKTYLEKLIAKDLHERDAIADELLQEILANE